MTTDDKVDLDLVTYSLGEPVSMGVYACRIPFADGIVPYRTLDRFFADDAFLYWDGSRWCYPHSDANYRGPVLAWVGPLERKLP